MTDKILWTKVDGIELILNGLCKVDSLEFGAKLYGGATKYKGEIYSNFYKDEYIYIDDNFNTLSLFVPSTININKHINNSKYVIKYYSKLHECFEGINNEMHYALGSFYSNELKSVIIEEVVIINFYFCNKITEDDINNFKNVALEMKKDMTQESVSIGINGALCLL